MFCCFPRRTGSLSCNDRISRYIVRAMPYLTVGLCYVVLVTPKHGWFDGEKIEMIEDMLCILMVNG